LSVLVVIVNRNPSFTNLNTAQKTWIKAKKSPAFGGYKSKKENKYKREKREKRKKD